MEEAPNSKYGKLKKITASVLGQILPVMLGVYLGFAMNNFGEAQKLKKQSIVFKSMLKNEIKGNLNAIESVSVYHIDLSSDLVNLLNSEEVQNDFNEYEFKGLRTGFVSTSAYETGIQTGIIQEFDLKLIQTLSRLYTLQGKYTRFNENMVQSLSINLYPESDEELKNDILSVSMDMNDVIIYEKDLMQFYQAVLSIL